MKVIWTRRAADQFERQAETIAEAHPRAAAEWVIRIRDAVLMLARFPLHGHRVHAAAEEGVREVIVQKHRIIYRADESSVTLLSIKHVREELSPADFRPDYP